MWLSLPLLTTLQFGNFHLVAVSGSILAMLALERGHHVLGGGLLAALALGKVFPGILVLLLLLQRRWRSVAWTAAFGALFLVISRLVLGEAPFRAMITYNMPRLSSGAALETQFAYPDAIAASHAIFGFVQKLELLGVPGASQRLAVVVSWLYTGVLFLFAVLGARAPRTEPLPRSARLAGAVAAGLAEKSIHPGHVCAVSDLVDAGLAAGQRRVAELAAGRAARAGSARQPR